MNLIDKYLLKQVFPVFVLGNIFFIFLLLLDKLVQLAELFFAKSVPAYLIIQTVIYYLPSFLAITIPTATLLSVLIIFSRMSVDSELIVIRASGAGFRQIFKPVFMFGVFATLLTLLMTGYLMPLGNKAAVGNLKQIAKSVSINDLKEKQLYKDIPGVLIYVKKIFDKNSFGQLIVVDKRQGYVITANKGNIITTDESEIVFDFREGTLMKKSGEAYSKIGFNTFKIRIPIPVMEDFEIQGERFMFLSQLVNNFDEKKYKFEFSKRFAIPFAAFIMAALGLTFGSFFQRAGKSLGVFFSLIVVFLYNFILIFSENMIGAMNPFLAAWIANIIFSIIAVIILRKVFR